MMRFLLPKRSVVSHHFVRNSASSAAVNVNEFDGKAAFLDRTTYEVARGLVLLKLASGKRFASSAETLYNAGQKLIGRGFTNYLLEKSFYAQFVSGAKFEDLQREAKRFIKHGNVKTMVCPAMEDLDGNSSNFGDMAKVNTKKFIDQIELAKRLNDSDPKQRAVVQYKLSAVFPVECMDVVSAAYDNKSKDWEAAVHHMLDVLQQKSQAKFDVDSRNNEAFQMGLHCTKEIFDIARQYGIPILIDAELRSSHTAMHALSVALAAIYNRINQTHPPLVYDTFQCYSKDTPRYIEDALRYAKRLNARLGGKFVRGAYMTLERKLAAERGIDDPIWSTYDQTSTAYNQSVAKMLEAVSENSATMFVASHNAESLQKAVQK